MRKRHPLTSFIGGVLLLALCALAWPIPPGTPITNTATATYDVGGSVFSTSASHTVITDPASTNSAPSSVSVDPADVDENLVAALIGTLTAVDSDPGDIHTFTVADPRFEVIGNELRLAAGESLDFEATSSVTVSITATDSSGASVTSDLPITVNDVNEIPTDITLSSLTFTADVLGAVVGDLISVDPDAGDSHTYVLDDARFEVVAGTLKLVDTVSLPLGTAVTLQITTTDVGGLSYTETFTVTAAPPGAGAGNDSSVIFFQFAPGVVSAAVLDVATAQCDAGGGYVDIPAIARFDGTPIVVPGSLELLAVDLFKSGSAIFMQVADPDANADPASVEAVLVVVSSAAGDSEALRFFETAVDSGIFVGFVQSAGGTVSAGNCVIDTTNAITVSYIDAADSTDTSAASALVDAVSRVFFSQTGQPVSGTEITLLDAASGLPAAVFGDNGVDGFPATVISGATAVDTGGANYSFADGAYRFPYVGSGDYLLRVDPPNRFIFPSALADPVLQLLPGAPFALGPGARGNVFTVPVGPAMRVDIPLDVAPIVPTTSTLELLSLSPGNPSSVAEVVQPTECFANGTYAPAPPPTDQRGVVAVVPASLELAPALRFASGDAIYLRLIDLDQDLDPFGRDHVLVDVSVPGQSDVERVRLEETAASSGVFVGFLQTNTGPASGPASGPADANDCALAANAGSLVEFRYVDALDGDDSALATALIDPGFTVFSSLTGALVDGVEVTLVDATTGQPATTTVFAADGVTPFPATVTSGGSVTDEAGNTVDFAPGSFRFPLVLPGSYRFEAVTAGTMSFPSVVPDVDLDVLPGGPFVLVPGSRGNEFDVLAGIPPAFDVPLDPSSAEVFLSKQASKEAAAIGDFVQYQVLVQNSALSSVVSDLVVTDLLPSGFRFVPGSARIDGIEVVDPSVGADGRSLVFEVPALAPGGRVELRYVTEITVGAPLGQARNEATASGSGIASVNVAFADVTVREDLLSSNAIVMGRVLDGSCGSQMQETGMPHVRLFLEDGTYVVTDSEGKYHFEGVEPGSHVVQLDVASLPVSHEAVRCEASSRFAGSKYSQFVDLQGGTLWQADFYVAEKPDRTTEFTGRLFGEAGNGRIRYRYQVAGGALTVSNVTSVVMLPDQLSYIAGSARFDGRAVADPEGADEGALQFRLADEDLGGDAGFTWVIEFDATVLDPRDEIVVKALTMLKSESGKHQTPVAVNEIELNGPVSLTSIAGMRDVQRGGDDGMATGAFEPTRGGHRSDSGVARLQVATSQSLAEAPPYVIPGIDDGAAPAFDHAWLAAQGSGNELVWPAADYNPRIPSITVAVKHLIHLQPQIMVDGNLINPLTFEGSTTDRARGLAVSVWDNVAIREGNSTISVHFMDDTGTSVESVVQIVHFSGAPVRAELVRDRSYLLADGITPPMIAVRLFDREGRPARPGISGEFSVGGRYQAYNTVRELDLLDNGFQQGYQRYQVRQDGIAFIRLEPTSGAGEVSLHFDFDQHRTQTIRARLQPGARDWVVVGLAEGVMGYNNVSGNMQSLNGAGVHDDLFTEGRVAFYAKGQIKGSWLLTARYDTDKKTEQRLRMQIDPNRFYTLYGDGAQQRYDAESQRKLYLKLERKDFAGLLGDFDTGFDDTEFTRYARTLNGLQGVYYGDAWEVSAFASETDQGYFRDEIRGDGTSGIYRLRNRKLVVNSERVTIVTRDRFKTENVLAEVALTRYLDYTIDYTLGTLVFKQPVFSQDQGFNPVFIEVSYEVGAQGESDEIVAGARVAYRLDDQDSVVALTYVNDGTAGREGDLIGLDLLWDVTPTTRLKAEAARTDTRAAGDATAFLIQLEHQGSKLAGRAYYREQNGAFGLGQQTALENATAKLGVEGEYRVSEQLLLRAEAFRQRDQASGNDRLVLSSTGEYRLGETRFAAGLRNVREQVSVGKDRNADQLTLGAGRSFLNNRLLLRGDAELDLSGGENTDYPSRAILGAEYKLTPAVSLIGAQEFSFADARDTQDTRLGVKARPWSGADINATLQRQLTENGERVFATTGLLQQLRLNESWTVDFGADRVQTLKRGSASEQIQEQLYNPELPPTSGSVNDDFSAFYAGAGYSRDQWNVSTRLELHQGDRADKWNYLLGASHQLADGKVMSASMSLLMEETATGSQRNQGEARFGIAWRPAGVSWLYLNRLDLIFNELNGNDFNTRTRKLVNNFNASFRPGQSHQLSVQLGLKYVVEDIDSDEYHSVTGLYGLEYRHSLGSSWDWAARAASLHSFNGDSFRYSAGISLGHNVFNNAWVSVGYNFVGFSDGDFVAADYTARGPYLKLRMKIDQDVLKRFLSFAGWGSRPATGISQTTRPARSSPAWLPGAG
ncbi:MAG: hypothetical protein O7B25_17725 [Gammaproteobacteria bacterium]|nr:hypothetical protein [Gammaproteobacteria bacterium]